ncbi:MAG: thioredoxin [Pyrinomonadaceae bacterium]
MAIITCAKCGAKNRVDEQAATAQQPVCGKCGAALETQQSGAGDVDTSKPRIVTDATFAREVLEAGNRPVLVDAWAPWCGPCRMIAPVLDKLAAESGGRYIIAKLNVDENPQTSARFGIQSIPTLLIFKNGTLADRMIGVQSKEAIAIRLR